MACCAHSWHAPSTALYLSGMQAPPVHEQLRLCGEVVVDDVVDERDVDTARCHVGGDEHAHLASTELGHVDLARSLRAAAACTSRLCHTAQYNMGFFKITQ
jgi:hypothetical protein